MSSNHIVYCALYYVIIWDVQIIDLEVEKRVNFIDGCLNIFSKSKCDGSKPTSERKSLA